MEFQPTISHEKVLLHKRNYLNFFSEMSLLKKAPTALYWGCIKTGLEAPFHLLFYFIKANYLLLCKEIYRLET